jgi:tetratricopeptide (TPR) repeat protein
MERNVNANVDQLLIEEARLRGRGDYDGALRVLERVLQLDPSRTDAHNNAGAILYMHGRIAEAAEHFERAVALQPRNAQAWNNLGECYHRLGRNDDAISALEHAIDSGYRHEGAYYNLGRALLSAGRTEAAMDQFIIALRTNPTYVPVLQTLAMIGRYYAGIDRPATVRDAERIKTALRAAGNPTILLV